MDSALAVLRDRLPPDLILARTSDQPLQVEENIHLLMSSLWEAVVLVVLVALVGFWEWRSAVLLALSIPLTLAMTFGMTAALGIDLQQVSIASLIIALGLLVDVPVVAGDAIKRELDERQAADSSPAGSDPRSWRGQCSTPPSPTSWRTCRCCCSRGNVGLFLYSMPVVLTCSLVAALIVSKTLIPLLSYYLLRPSRKPPVPLEERRHVGLRRVVLPRGPLGHPSTGGRWRSRPSAFSPWAAGS